VKTLIIAEAGVNHNGDLEMARRLVEVAAQAGADFVKFQTFKADRLVTRQAAKAEYQRQLTADDESQYDMIRRLELTPEMHIALIEHCASQGIRFLSTGFDIESLNMLAEFGIPIFKVPSGEITNLPYLQHVGRIGKQVILSTGMADMAEIGAALDALEQAGAQRQEITVLHCNTEYPTPMRDVNLRAMLSIRDAFGVQVGYSDHSAGIEVSLAAVALGATVIEKHFTLDRQLPGPDHQASLEPDELKTLVAGIRNIELALGDGTKHPSPSEAKNIPIVRKSLVAARSIRAGEPFSRENLAVKRPGTGVSPMRLDEVLGRLAKRDFQPDELIDL
jgi:N,N'-diacetyllegionaminate synthase